MVAALAWFSKDRFLNRKTEEPLADSMIAAPPVQMFGIPVDSYYTETGIVKRNQILAQILRDYSLPEGAMTQLVTLPGTSLTCARSRREILIPFF